MPSASAIAIGKDAIPTIQTFDPVSVGNVSTFQDKTAALLEGRASITISHRLATPKVAARTRAVIKVPVEEVVDGVTVVTSVDTAIIELIASNKSVSASRTALRYLVSNLVLDPTLVTVVDDGEQIFG
jgi:hypothetical protein